MVTAVCAYHVCDFMYVAAGNSDSLITVSGLIMTKEKHAVSIFRLHG